MDRKVVVVNQAVNYLTIGFANAFKERFDEVALITGSIHVQGEELHSQIKVNKINKWQERPAWKKFVSYLIGTIRIWFLLMTRYRQHEVFFVSLPPMGYFLNLLLPHRYSMVIWDVYPDVFKITGMSESHGLYRFWASLNKKSFKKAFCLFTISERMADLLEQYVSRNKIIIQPIWSIFQEDAKVEKDNNPFAIEHKIQDNFVVQYSGNIGLTHKVEVMVQLAELMQDNNKVLFQIIGRGPRKRKLQELVESRDLSNIQFLPFQSDEMFPYSLSAADLGVVVLDELTSQGSVPSKSYNLMSYGIPSLYIASKDSQLNLYAEEFNHARCFTSLELNEAAEFIKQISSSEAMHARFSHNARIASEHFRRDNADKLVSEYLKNVPKEILV